MAVRLQLAVLVPCDNPPSRQPLSRAEFEDVYATLADTLTRRVLPIVRNRADAEDVTQQAFAQAWSTLEQFDPERGDVGAWLSCIARARAIDFLRRDRRRFRLLSSEVPVHPPAFDVAQMLDDRARSDHIEAVMAELPEFSRQALRLAYDHGLSHSQIAAHLGRPLGTIKTVIRNGLGSIRASLRDGAVLAPHIAAAAAQADEQPFTIEPLDEAGLEHPRAEPPQAARLDGVHVMCVDDDDRTRELLDWVLRRAGARCTTCASAAESLSVLDVVWPDVLVADIAMPGTDGHSLMGHVQAKARSRGLRLRALAFTACGREDERARALLAGFSAHLGKPVHPTAVVSAVLALTREA
jgi:RNA polymerase sigma factor (sigma-70 family)